MNNMKEAMGEALKRRKKNLLEKEGDQGEPLLGAQDMDPGSVPPEVDEQEQKSADLAPDVKDGGKMSGIKIEISGPPGTNMQTSQMDNNGPDLSKFLGKEPGQDEIAQMAGVGRPKSLYEAATKAMASKKMKA